MEAYYTGSPLDRCYLRPDGTALCSSSTAGHAHAFRKAYKENLPGLTYIDGLGRPFDCTDIYQQWLATYRPVSAVLKTKRVLGTIGQLSRQLYAVTGSAELLTSNAA